MEGVPVYVNRQLLLFAIAVMSVYIEKQRQEVQRAASLATAGS